MRSMTGYGKSEGKIGATYYSIEVKSVNHRFLDFRYRMPPQFAAFELVFCDIIRQHFERGAFEINVKQKYHASNTQACAGSYRIVVDKRAAESFFESAKWLAKKYELSGQPSWDALVAQNRIFVPIEDTEISPPEIEQIKQLFGKATGQLKDMRCSEGKEIKKILGQALENLKEIVAKIRELAPLQPQSIEKKLKERIEQWKLTTPVDQARLEWEVAFYADRADLSEEIDRLSCHLEEFAKVLRTSDGKTIGRKLDFLTQELHRETNTLGVKASSIDITRLSLDAKATIEKLREQVQNVE